MSSCSHRQTGCKNQESIAEALETQVAGLYSIVLPVQRFQHQCKFGFQACNKGACLPARRSDRVSLCHGVFSGWEKRFL